MDKVKGKDLSFKHYYLNEKTGEVMEGTVKLSLNKDYAAGDGKTVATFNAAYIGEVVY